MRNRIVLALVLILALVVMIVPQMRAASVSALNYATAGGKSWIVRGILTINSGATFTSNALFNANAGIACSGALDVDGVAAIDKFKFGATLTQADGTETLTAAQTGLLVICTKADGTTTITLPDPSAATVGVVYYVLQTANQNVDIVPTTANGNSIIADAVATSDKVSLATAGHLIGSGALVIGVSATKWQIIALSPTCPLTVEAAD